MTTAVITFVYNEAVNLPIWRRYYGGIFGERNLFVIDHSSSDGSTDDLGDMNKLWLHREELDERKLPFDQHHVGAFDHPTHKPYYADARPAR